MQNKLFVLLFFILIFSLTFSSNYEKKRKRQPKNIQDDNTQEENFQIVSPPSTSNLQTSNTIFSDLLKTEAKENSNVSRTQEDAESSFVSSNSLNNLLKIPNLFQYYIFPYLSLFELELKLKCMSTTFSHLYEKLLQEEKNFLKENLKNKAKFEENIKCTRVYFDFFERRRWSKSERIEYANVDYFSEDLVLLPKSIRQIICFTFNKIEYKYVLFKNENLSILKKLNKEGKFVFTSLENDFKNFDCWVDRHYRTKHFTTHTLEENIRHIQIACLIFTKEIVRVDVMLCKNNHFKQYISHIHNHAKINIYQSFGDYPRVFLKNFSGYLSLVDGFVTLWRFKKQDNGIYISTYTNDFKLNVKAIKSKDFEHDAEDVSFIFKTDDN